MHTECADMEFEPVMILFVMSLNIFLRLNHSLSECGILTSVLIRSHNMVDRKCNLMFLRDDDCRSHRNNMLVAK